MKLEVTNFDTDPATANARARAAEAKPWVTLVDAGRRKWRVVGRKATNGKYVVRFTVEDGRRFGECFNVKTGENCQAGSHGLYCYHMAAAYRRQVTYAARQLRKGGATCQIQRAA
jgi:hypothetical protein